MAHSPRSEAKSPQGKAKPAASSRSAKTSAANGAAKKHAGAAKSKPIAQSPVAAATPARASKQSSKQPQSSAQRSAPPASVSAKSGSAPKTSASKLNVPAKALAASGAEPLAASSVKRLASTNAGAGKVSRKASAKTLEAAASKSNGKSTAAAASLTDATARKKLTAAPSSEKTPPSAPAAASAPPPKRPARKSIKEAAGVSTDAVARRTGKNWDDWFEVLDNAGAATLDQRGIIAILAQKHGIGPWWQQMIAVGYESLRAKSDKPPAADGFQISSSCTLQAPLARVFRLWNDAGERARWLSDDRFVVRGTSGEKTLRARWGKGTSHVAVSFAEKSGRTHVSVDHMQIESRDAAEQMKAYWAKKLGLLDQALGLQR